MAKRDPLTAFVNVGVKILKIANQEAKRNARARARAEKEAERVDREIARRHESYLREKERQERRVEREAISAEKRHIKLNNDMKKNEEQRFIKDGEAAYEQRCAGRERARNKIIESILS